MYKKSFFLTVLLVAYMTLPGAAETVEGLPLHLQTIAPGVIRLWVGNHVSSTAVAAIATQKGIVVIDSTYIPKLDRAFRKVIAKELGRSDFKYLINTHGHADHTNGNGVYADCQIIAFESVPAMMRENFSDHFRVSEWVKEDILRQKELIASGKLDVAQKTAVEEQLIVNTLHAEFLNSSPTPTFPDKSFADKLTLDCGDVTFELYQAGGTHTQSDIFILVPQKGILFTGDMMADKWLSDSPGCLATFAVRSGTVADYPVLVKNWQALIERKDEIRQYIPGHWNGELSFEGFRNRFEYLKTLLADVKVIAKAGGDFSQFVAGYALKEKFPLLVNSPGFSDQGHQMSVRHLYQIFSGKLSVAEALQKLFQNDSFSSDFPKLKADIIQAREKYFYAEAELNGLGYFLLLEQKQVEGAIELFGLNVVLHPASGNAYDSLAEAYYEKGDKQKALELYKKSLELNPANENGKKFIERIENELKK
jgi:glyoxylase-like metal-dependent hydrolase (beta-lactamase superfamily II)